MEPLEGDMYMYCIIEMITKVTFSMQTIVDNPLFNTLLPLDKMSVINSGL